MNMNISKIVFSLFVAVVAHAQDVSQPSGGSGGAQVYPAAGIANSTGSAWGTSYTATGSGTVVALATSPTFVTPVLGTPTSVTLTNGTGLPFSGLAAGTATAAMLVGASGSLGPTSTGTVTANLLATPSLGTTPLTNTYCVGTGGVTQGQIVKKDASNPTCVIPIAIEGTEDGKAIGIAMTTQSAAANVEVAVAGIAQAIADGSVTAGHFLILGSSTAARAKDSTLTSAQSVSQINQHIGFALANATVGNLVNVQLCFPSCFGGSLTLPSGVVPRANGGTENTLGAFASVSPIHLTAQTASISTANVCSTTGCPVGQYEIVYNFVQGGTACGTPGTGGVSLALTWTDAAGAHSAVAVPMTDSVGLTPVNKFTFQTSNTAAWASGQFTLWTTGASAIQYATTYTACSSGTGTYEVDISASRRQ